MEELESQYPPILGDPSCFWVGHQIALCRNFGQMFALRFNQLVFDLL